MKYPRRFCGINSTPSVNMEGTVPPTPTPQRHRISVSSAMDGMNEENTPAIVTQAKHRSKVYFRPSLSPEKPTKSPPTNMPK
mmetsp:Transcript_5549/g.6758  ORF Transcript_5549/g.6758 Transcript_5549/m.6758 type:complete len:82 (-) Transcript_5549:42-287(-)